MNLAVALMKLPTATRAEDVFGELTGSTVEQLDAAKRLYRQMARELHPDSETGNETMMKKASALYDECKARIANGVYGQCVTLTVKSKKYELGKVLSGDEISTAYYCTGPLGVCALKLVNNGRDNDLMQREAEALKKLKGAHVVYFPGLLESFEVGGKGKSRRRANLLTLPSRACYSLEQVRAQYPGGVEPRAVAWIFKRMLAASIYVRELGLVYGGMVPSGVYVRPDDHGATLVNWYYSSTGKPLTAVHGKYRDFYPPEVLSKSDPTPAVDIYMAAKCASYLLEGQVVPRAMQGFLNACLLPSPQRRFSDALKAHKDFDEVLEDVYGAPKFIPFRMSEVTT